MALIELIFIITLGATAGWLFYSANQQQQAQKQIEKTFYQLLETQDSCISLIQLAVGAKVDSQLAQQYLERQVKLLGGVLEFDVDGDTFYRFPKLRLQSDRRE